MLRRNEGFPNGIFVSCAWWSRALARLGELLGCCRPPAPGIYSSAQHGSLSNISKIPGDQKLWSSSISRFPGYRKLCSSSISRFPGYQKLCSSSLSRFPGDQKLWSSSISKFQGIRSCGLPVLPGSQVIRSCGLPIFPGLRWPEVVVLQYCQVSGDQKLWSCSISRFPSFKSEQISMIINFPVPWNIVIIGRGRDYYKSRFRVSSAMNESSVRHIYPCQVTRYPRGKAARGSCTQTVLLSLWQHAYVLLKVGWKIGLPLHKSQFCGTVNLYFCRNRAGLGFPVPGNTWQPQLLITWDPGNTGKPQLLITWEPGITGKP